MKQFWKEVGAAIVLGMIMPGFILHIVTYSARHHVMEDSGHEPTEATQSEDEPVRLSVLDKHNSVQEQELEAYLVGVVLAEMPASFETEALKAQSVVARTYALRALYGKGKHEQAAICMNPDCCQGYISQEDYINDGGRPEDLQKVKDAVSDTAWQVLCYDGALIEATYFSCSGGATEDAVAVWGTDVPYLRSVESPGEEDAAYYTDSITFTRDELKSLLGIYQGEINIENPVYTAGGGVATVTIGGVRFEGTKLRSLLGLRSTAFTVTESDDRITFHTRGYGHRVGMSQYGADAMAVSGCDYRQILQHYYQGTELKDLRIDKVENLG